MKLLHCADLHLDSSLSMNFTVDSGRERKAELLNNFVRLTDYANDHEIFHILIAGDLFDRANVSRTASDIVFGCMRSNPHISYYWLKGNHDGTCVYEADMPCNLYTFTNEWTSYELLRSENRSIMLYGVCLNSDNSPAVLQSFTANPANVNIVTLHGNIYDSIGNFAPDAVNLRCFKNKNVSYMALGHIHEYRTGILEGKAKFCYPGCLEARGFDEPGEHGFVVLGIDEDTGRVTDTFVPFARRHVFEVSVDVAGSLGTEEIYRRVSEEISLTKAEPCDFIKVILKGAVDAESDLDTEYLKKAIEGRFAAVRIDDETKVYIDPARYRYDNTLKGEFVRLISEEDLPEADKDEIIKIGIRALKGEL